jgi:hypothetical protein
MNYDDYTPDHQLIAAYAVPLFDHLVDLQQRLPGQAFTADSVTSFGFPIAARDKVETLLGALERINVVSAPDAYGARTLLATARKPRKAARRMVAALASTAASYPIP